MYQGIGLNRMCYKIVTKVKKCQKHPFFITNTEITMDHELLKAFNSGIVYLVL